MSLYKLTYTHTYTSVCEYICVRVRVYVYVWVCVCACVYKVTEVIRIRNSKTGASQMAHPIAFLC